MPETLSVREKAVIKKRYGSFAKNDWCPRHFTSLYYENRSPNHNKTVISCLICSKIHNKPRPNDIKKVLMGSSTLFGLEHAFKGDYYYGQELIYK
jgi:hypothetical protein